MACDLQRIAKLPVPEKYKMALLEYFQNPEHTGECEKLMEVSDEEIMGLIQQMDQSINQQGAQGQGPGAPPGQPPPSGGGGGQPMPGGQPPLTPPGLPPGELADVRQPMNTPAGGIGALKQGGGYA